MMSKKGTYRIIGLAMLFVTGIPAQVTAGYGLSIETENSTRARVKDVRYQTTDKGVEVSGVVRSRFHRGRILGHVDVKFTDEEGQVLVTRTAKLIRVTHSNRHQHRVRFTTRFEELPAGAVNLKISHHVGTKMH